MGINDFDEATDVVVVGYGFAGAVAALSACEAGADVILLEKSPDPGGISICSQGAVCCARNADHAFAYLKATNGDRVPDVVTRALADGMTECEAFVRDLAGIANANITVRERGGNYPFPHRKAFHYTTVESIPGFNALETYPHVRGRIYGAHLFRLLELHLEKQDVDVRLATAADRLIRDGDNQVIGLTVRSEEGTRKIAARKGVVLACGGFEASDTMKNEYWQQPHVLSAANKFNTGDGVRMAQSAGADLWHMWHYHGSYGFRHPDPDYPYGVRVKRFPDWVPDGSVDEPIEGDDQVSVPMAWILVNRHGRRFMNEQHPYMQDTTARPFENFDPVTMSFPAVPCWLICDEAGRKLYPLGNPTYNDRTVSLDWSPDNSKEIAEGILKRANSITELAQTTGMPEQQLAATITRWNAMVDAGRDDQFERPAGGMVPISEPPFYAGEIWPVVSNTQGGPVHDARQRILDVYGDPIVGLYAAGELGSCFGHIYLGGGNISECIVTGRIAGSEAARAGASGE
ncbi:MAG: FAD-dependent oxidoreductase [Pseudomonadota bacterium]